VGALYLRPTPASAWSARRAVVFDLAALSVSADIIDEVAMTVAELVSDALIPDRSVISGHIYLRWNVESDVLSLELRAIGAYRESRRQRVALTRADASRPIERTGVDGC
jgi:hypothetical protein